MGVPQCLVVVDASGEVLASLRMDGARFLSMRTAQAKARTAASINAATGGMAFEAALSAGIASQGGVTNLPGGLADPLRRTPCGRHRRRVGNRRFRCGTRRLGGGWRRRDFMRCADAPPAQPKDLQNAI
ncbi:heme-binding protein [Mesorhizobium sp. M0954]|uniref:GlcG/HbpS family heme-binding protein n=1 Tax=Mesorhizobium sp. M0954 TaxID=2957032 RepID=UPI0033390D9F